MAVYDAADVRSWEDLAPATTCRLIDFETAELRPGIIHGTYFLAVTGTKPWITMTVLLQPRIYIEKPDYWAHEVVGCMAGIDLPVTAPYGVFADVSASMGHRGVEVVGATRSEQLDLPR